jgi:hypothetical protein
MYFRLVLMSVSSLPLSIIHEPISSYRILGAPRHTKRHVAPYVIYQLTVQQELDLIIYRILLSQKSAYTFFYSNRCAYTVCTLHNTCSSVQYNTCSMTCSGEPTMVQATYGKNWIQEQRVGTYCTCILKLANVINFV